MAAFLYPIAQQFSAALALELGSARWATFLAMSDEERYRWLCKNAPKLEAVTSGGLSVVMGKLPGTRRVQAAMRKRLYRLVARLVGDASFREAAAIAARDVPVRKNGGQHMREVPVEEVSADLRSRYKSSHWGIEPRRAYHITDPDYPDELCIMGEFVGLIIESPDAEVEVQCDDPQSFVTFTQTDDERVYIVTSPEYRRWCKGELWEKGAPTYPLAAVAKRAPGRQDDYGGWTPVRVQPIGICTHIIYRTHKKGDGLSEYIHEFGEEGGAPPIATIDAKGRLWLAGGNYSVPDAGITD